MAKIKEREEAIELRVAGKSIGEIAKKLHVSKSTASFWCRDIILTDRQIQTIARKSRHHATEALLRSSELRRAKREEDTEIQTNLGKKDVGPLSKRERMLVGLGLYWGEGYKRGSQELGFTNSDPDMILFYIRWLQQVYEVGKDRLILRVSINEQHRYRISEVEKYWSTLTEVPLSQFTKSSLIKTASTKLYTKKDAHFGTLRVKVKRGTSLRRRILGSIEALRITK